MSSAEIYDPKTGKFSATGSMNRPRFCQTATLLASGKVLIVGGSDDNSAELYDPTAGKFSLTGSYASVGREGNTATLLRDGRVLVAGGLHNGDLTIAEIYDPATGKFSLTGHMIDGPSYQTATLLRDGRVLIVGGQGSPTSAQLYWP